MSRTQSDGLEAIVTTIPEFENWTVKSVSHIAALWSNYGSIKRVTMRSPKPGQGDKSLIVKTISPPKTAAGHADEGHMRKLLSYEVERWFYYNLAAKLPNTAKVATPYSSRQGDGHVPSIRLLMEDLSVDYPHPACGSLGLEDTKAVLSWLATFHGTFWAVHREPGVASAMVPPPSEHNGGSKQGVWQQGTYWYLDTRRSEFDDIDDGETWLLAWAEKVDKMMKSEAHRYGTLLHGDAKGANIFFAPRPETTSDAPLLRKCALYDFQYVGRGLVTRDLIYFLGTTVRGGLLKRIDDEKALLSYYHSDLAAALQKGKDAFPAVAAFLREHGEYSFDALWFHWELAIVDWYRFMAGWGSWGNDDWVERRARDITARWKEVGLVPPTL